MRLSPTPEQQELKDAVRRFCEEQVTPERLAAWQQEATGIDEECWQSAVRLGWIGLGLPPAAGGSGLGLVEVACLLEECGRGLIPRRVINAIRGAVALASLDAGNEHLPSLASGERTVALALDEHSSKTPQGYGTRVEGDGKSARLRGEKWFVADGAHADLHLVAADWNGEPALVLAMRHVAPAAALRTFDDERQAITRYDGVPILQRLSPVGEGERSLVALRRQQAALGLAEMVGGMDAALEMTVAYVKEREQFGQKIAVFQAVQHQVADMATLLTASRHLAWQAITRCAAGTDGTGELSVAAAFVAQSFKRVTLAAHHLHGGAGYVIEHPLHYHAERALSLCIRYAPEGKALSEVAARLLDDSAQPP